MRSRATADTETGLGRARDQAAVALGLPAGSPLVDDQQSVVFKYLLLGELEDAGAWRRRWRKDPRQTGPALYQDLEHALHTWQLRLRQSNWLQAAALDS